MLRALFPPATETRAQSTDWGTWPGESSGPSWSGAEVTASTSMQLLTVYGCVRLISDSISTLPVDVYREFPDGTKQEISTPVWLRSPTVDLSFSEWCSQVLSSLLLHGNAYVWVTRNESNAIVELVPLDPTVVTVRRVNGRKTFLIHGVDRGLEIVHIKGLMLAGSDVGYSPIEAARQSVGLGLAATKFGGEFFAGEGNMPGVIEAPRPIQPAKATELAAMWRRKRSKGGRGLPGVLDDGMTWRPTGVTNEQAQFLATRNYTAAEIAGQMFLLDPSDLGIAVSGSSLSYANLEQRNARRVQVTLLPWIVRIEAALSGLLFNPRYMKFNLEGLLRGDTLSRYQAHSIGIASGFLLPEEARDIEDLPQIPGTPLPPGEEPSGTTDA